MLVRIHRQYNLTNYWIFQIFLRSYIQKYIFSHKHVVLERL
jgi:hypothetical protein